MCLNPQSVITVGLLFLKHGFKCVSLSWYASSPVLMELSGFFFFLNQLRTIVATSQLKKTPLQTQNGVSFTSTSSPSCVYPTACGPFQCLPRLSSGYALIL